MLQIESKGRFFNAAMAIRGGTLIVISIGGTDEFQGWETCFRFMEEAGRRRGLLKLLGMTDGPALGGSGLYKAQKLLSGWTHLGFCLNPDNLFAKATLAAIRVAGIAKVCPPHKADELVSQLGLSAEEVARLSSALQREPNLIRGHRVLTTFTHYLSSAFGHTGQEAEARR